MPPAYEVLLLNTAVPQIQAAQAGDTYVVPRDIAVNANMTVTGNVGIGTSSPGAKLEVDAGTNTDIRVNTSGSGYLQLGQFTNGAFIGTSSTDPTAGILRLGTGGTTRATLDSSGNLGLGVTPSAWRSTTKAFQGTAGAIYDFSTTGKGITQNAYLKEAPDAWAYVNDGHATQYDTGSGAHAWFTAPSGTAGNAISFTQAMTLDASGNLLVGTTSASYSAAGRGLIEVNGSSSFLYAGKIGDAQTAYFGGSASTVELATVTNIPLVFLTNNTERARITSGGDVQVSSGGSVQVGGTAARATTAGTNRIDIFDGTAPVGTLANGVSFYSASGEANVMDAAGNATLLSPHDSETNEWIFRSKHTPTGKVLRIDVERLLRFVNDHFGLDAVKEFVEE
jgi:hypothetical protein